MNTTTTINATETTGILGYHPEMGEKRPAAKIEASLSHSGKHWFVYSAVPLTGRGVDLLGVVKPGDMCNDRRNGWGNYRVTEKAFEAIKAKHAVAVEILL